VSQAGEGNECHGQNGRPNVLVLSHREDPLDNRPTIGAD
jgi:hypothetical protein